MRKALIVGCNGQDGSLLSCLLLEKGYAVSGIDISSRDSGSRVERHSVDIRDASAVAQCLGVLQPDEVYYLAAFHASSEALLVNDAQHAASYFAINAVSLSHFLNGIAARSAASRLFYAASSKVFGYTHITPQDEDTPMNPACLYGISKSAGVHLCRFYRAEREVFCSAGILFNHESSLRGAEFLSKKVVSAAVRIKKGEQESLAIGNLSAVVDWGYAPDYVAAMWHMLQMDLPGDFVIATGVTHTVRDFVELAFEAVGLDWKHHVVERESLVSAGGTAVLRGNATKLRSHTAWRPSVSFPGMVRLLVQEELVAYERESVRGSQADTILTSSAAGGRETSGLSNVLQKRRAKRSARKCTI